MGLFGKETAPPSEMIIPRRVPMGIAASNLGNEYSQEHPLPQETMSLVRMLNRRNLGLELQMEGEGLEKANRQVFIPTEQRPRFLGVHQPTTDVDFLEPEKVYASLQKSFQAMEMADRLNANYFVVHLQTKDRWESLESRPAQIEMSLSWFAELITAYMERDYHFPILVENLEYPKYPATRREIMEVVYMLRPYVAHKLPLGIAFDVGHLWHSGFLIRENLHNPYVAAVADSWARKETPFEEHLALTVDLIGDDMKVVHMTGCYEHATHLLPGSIPNSPIIKIDRTYTPEALNVAEATRIIFDRGAISKNPPYVVNEAIGYHYLQMAENCEMIYQFQEGNEGEV